MSPHICKYGKRSMRRHGRRLPCRHTFCYAGKVHATTWYEITMSPQVFIMPWVSMRRHGMHWPCRHKLMNANKSCATTWFKDAMSTQVRIKGVSRCDDMVKCVTMSTHACSRKEECDDMVMQSTMSPQTLKNVKTMTKPRLNRSNLT